MYQPPLFKEDRPEVLHALIQAHPFATLVSHGAAGLAADHIPMVLYPGEGLLRGHIAIANPLAKAEAGAEVLAIFQGPHSYISPGWYPTKQEHGKVVPTWNYAVVHAAGRIAYQRDPAWLLAHLNALTAQHEGGRAAPWAVSDAPDDFIARQMKGIVGVEVAITDLTGKWKVSQNRTAADQAGVVAGLTVDGSAPAMDMADLVAARGRQD